MKQNTFLKQQQELAREYSHVKGWEIDTAKMVVEITPEELDTLIQQIITNTGEELMRRAEGERDDTCPSPASEPTSEYVARLKERRITIDTIKQHITSVTGVE